MSTPGPATRDSLLDAITALGEDGRATLASEEGSCRVRFEAGPEGVEAVVTAPSPIRQHEVIAFGRRGWEYQGERRFRRRFEPDEAPSAVADEVAAFAATRVGDDPGVFWPSSDRPAPPRAAAPRAGRAPAGPRTPRPARPRKEAPAPRPARPAERLCPGCFTRRPEDQFRGELCVDCAG